MNQKNLMLVNLLINQLLINNQNYYINQNLIVNQIK